MINFHEIFQLINRFKIKLLIIQKWIQDLTISTIEDPEYQIQHSKTMPHSYSLSFHAKDSIYQYSDVLNSSQIRHDNPEKSNNNIPQKYRERSSRGYGYINDKVNMTAN